VLASSEQAATPSISGIASDTTFIEPDSSIVGARLFAAVKNNNPDVVFECVRTATAAEINWINKDEVCSSILSCYFLFDVPAHVLYFPLSGADLHFFYLQVEGTALISACVRGRTAIAKALIEHPDIDVNLQGQVSTVLHQFFIPLCSVKLQILPYRTNVRR